MLIILGGLPGVGKSSIGKNLAAKLTAVYLRIDSIEQALKNTYHAADKDNYKIGLEGYAVAYSIAHDNLEVGLNVIADSVNPVSMTRSNWRNVAIELNKPFFEVEIICSDKIKHKERVENRKSTIPGLRLPSWQSVLNREYEIWQTKHLTIDTATCTINEAADNIIAEIYNYICQNRAK